MGYYSRVHGYITIKPPLSPDEIKDSPIDYFQIEEDGSGLDFNYSEGKFYYLEENLKEFVEHYPTHAFGGTIAVYGEDQTDIWRLNVKSVVEKIKTTVTREDATVRWPDGTEVESSY